MTKKQTSEDLSRFANLDYEGFRRLAVEPGLGPNERIGFPESYRQGKDQAILADICRKIPELEGSRERAILDIGPGCAQLPRLLASLCERQKHRLVFIDSPEMLAQLSDLPQVEKIPGFFPRDFKEWVTRSRATFNAVLSYSVAHYVFVEHSIFDFVDVCMQLLAPGGVFLLGDLPNVSQRKRFFASETGVRFHQEFMKTTEAPRVEFNTIERGSIDDGVVLGIVARCRQAGYDAWIVPQAADLPMANRREDLLIRRP
jgi:hypothetical protein